MCEILVINPQTAEAESIVRETIDMYRSNPDGLGIVAIYHDPDNGKFNYVVGKGESPTKEAIHGFLEENRNAWRIVVHARLTTVGGNGHKETHPIQLDCKACEPNFLVHNGIVYGHRQERDSQTAKGHEHTTMVDSEVIGHAWEDMPQTPQEASEERPSLNGSLNYILFNEDIILVHNHGKYGVSQDFEMSIKDRCSVDPIDTPTWTVVNSVQGQSNPWIQQSNDKGHATRGKWWQKDSSGSEGSTWYDCQMPNCPNEVSRPNALCNTCRGEGERRFLSKEVSESVENKVQSGINRFL